MKKEYIKYLAALLLFGTNGIIASYIAMASYEIVFLRTLIGSLLLVFLLKATREKFNYWEYKKSSLFIILSGIAMGLSWMFLYEAYQEIGVSLASLAYYCGPVILMALSPILFKEKLTLPKLLGFAGVLCGILLVNGPAIKFGNVGWGFFCGGMSAIFYALMVIFNKRSDFIHGLENAALQLTVSFITVGAFIVFRQSSILSISGEDWIPILFLGIVNTGIGCYFYFSSIGHLPVQTVAIFGYLEPLSAVLFSVLLLQEKMIPVQILGGLLLLGGAAFAQWAGLRPSLKQTLDESRNG